MAKEDSAKISLDDVIAAAGQGALRSLNARQMSATTNNGFYIDVHIRCGMPAVSLPGGGVVEHELERGPRPPGPPRKD
jgi:hypothetical protein